MRKLTLVLRSFSLANYVGQDFWANHKVLWFYTKVNEQWTRARRGTYLGCQFSTQLYPFVIFLKYLTYLFSWCSWVATVKLRHVWCLRCPHNWGDCASMVEPCVSVYWRGHRSNLWLRIWQRSCTFQDLGSLMKTYDWKHQVSLKFLKENSA